MTLVETQNKAGFSIACALGASLAFSFGDITVKSFAESLPLHEVVLVRSIVGMAITLLFFAPGQSIPALFKTRRMKAHIFRGLCVVIANFTFFAGLAVLPLAEASAIFFVAPLLITAFSAIILREYVGPWRWSALVVGMSGVLMIVKPGGVSFEWAVLLPVLSAIAYAGMHTMTRNMGMGESPVTMSLYIQMTFLVACIAMGVLFGDGHLAGSGHPALEFLFRAWVWPNGQEFALMFIAGLSTGIGGYLIGQAYRSSPAGLVAPFEYSALVLATFWGFMIWGEVPRWVSGFGILLILSSGIFVALREARHNVRPAAKRASGRR